jgi:phosphopantetheine adenylyltransferase
MIFSFAKKVDSAASQIAALQSQVENARRRITELTLENIQQAHEIVMLNDYRGMTVSETPRPMLMVGREMTIPAPAANSEIGLLFTRVAV